MLLECVICKNVYTHIIECVYASVFMYSLLVLLQMTCMFVQSSVCVFVCGCVRGRLWCGCVSIRLFYNLSFMVSVDAVQGAQLL